LPQSTPRISTQASLWDQTVVEAADGVIGSTTSRSMPEKADTRRTSIPPSTSTSLPGGFSNTLCSEDLRAGV
jgi:hypothetical protein